MKAPAEITTARLVLRRPVASDAEEIFKRYASDASVCRYLAWPIHTTVADTRAFLEFSDQAWEQWPAGPYLIFSKDTRTLLGSTGLSFETLGRASIGCVLARDSWDKGFATEATRAMKHVAAQVGADELFACCHPDHQPSRRVLEKCGFAEQRSLHRKCEFPNLTPGKILDAVCYVWTAKLEQGKRH